MVNAIAKAQQGMVAPSGRLTLEAYLRDWLEAKERELRPTTALRYRGLLEGQVIPVIGRVKLAQLQPRHVERVMAAAVDRGLAPRTANHARAVLRAALTDATRHGLMARNVAGGKLVKPRRVDAPGVEPMDSSEARAILEVVHDTPLEAPVATALWLGLRQGEILGLRWRDISKDYSILRVAGALHHRAGEWSWRAPKTEQSRRTLSIPEPLAEVLRAHRATHPMVLLTPDESDSDIPRDLVFTTPSGMPIEGTGLTHRFQESLRRAGLRLRRFHDLRHGTATLLLASGVDIKTVSAILGHSSIGITANTYASVLPSLHAEAAAKMARLLG
jgi:integrase